MGKPLAAKRTGDNTDALSLHTTPDDYDYDALPSYTDSETAAASRSAERTLLNHPTFISHNQPQDEYNQAPVTRPSWVRVGGSTTKLAEVSTRIDERLTDPYNLYAYIMDCVRMIPPKPMIRLMGHHNETRRDHNDKKSTERVVDFDVNISLQSMLREALVKDWWNEMVVHNDDKAYRGSFRKTRAVGHTQGIQLSDEPIPDLKEWCERYCASPSKLKVFRVTRMVQGLDNALLESMIVGMIRETEYRGRLEITFPVEGKYVDVYTPHWVNKWRNSWVRFLFYFTMLWILTWPILFFTTKWYAVYNVVWNFSIPVESSDNRQYATMSEQKWFEVHKKYLKHLVLDRFQGEVDMSPSVINEFNSRPPPVRATSGNVNVDSAINLVSAGANMWNQFSRGHQVSVGAWGYDT
ncbi:hypothetical protein AMS68_001671 [Peltaster fructicola]|uniref:Uncharacterized protein n=1 Tax=Peltaster fructicola TaxID=286661 RepID=A0A6H0XN54_9PEZI|nr:hypothetical protein AMS68_001671 [Peltaster fructicola]